MLLDLTGSPSRGRYVREREEEKRDAGEQSSTAPPRGSMLPRLESTRVVSISRLSHRSLRAPHILTVKANALPERFKHVRA